MGFLIKNHKDWDDEFMTMVRTFECKSHCAAKKVVCIITKQNNVLSIGINGTLENQDNCDKLFRRKKDGGWERYKGIDFIHDDAVASEVWEDISHLKDTDKGSHHYWSEVNEIHAEVNAIYRATQTMNANIEGATVYVSNCPCLNCAKMLALYKVKRVVYRDDYDNSKDSVKFLELNGIEVLHYAE